MTTHNSAQAGPDGLSRELRVLLKIAAGKPAVFEPNLDWERLLTLADRHGLYPQLAEAAVPQHGDALPPGIAIRLAEGRRQRRLVNQMLEIAAVEAVGALAGSAIPSALFKGPALDQALFRGRRLRQYADIDLWVTPKDVARAIPALRRLGYRAETSIDDPVHHPVHRSNGEISLQRGGTGATMIDLHWRLLPGTQPQASSLAGFERRLEMVSIAGTPLPTLADGDLLVYLCHHASKGACHRLAQLQEIGLILAKVAPDIVASRIAEAEQDGLLRSFLLPLHLAWRLLKCQLPADAPKAFGRAGGLSSLAALIVAGMEAVEPPPPHAITRALWPSPLERARQALLIAFVPQPADWWAVPLADRWAALYYVIRPLRITHRAVRRGLKSRS